MSVSITNLENLFNNSVNFNDNFRTDTEYKLVLNQNEENRTFLSILDSENNPFLPNPVFFEGIERNLFEKIESLQKNKFIFSWENNSSDVNPIFLDEHDVLSNMFFESGLPLYFKNVKNEISVQNEDSDDENAENKDENELSFVIEDEKSFYKYKRYKKIIFLTKEWILCDKKIFRIKSSAKYNFLPNFEGKIEKVDVSKLLSLFASYFPEIKIAYKDYENENGEFFDAERSIQFKCIDEDDNLNIAFFWFVEHFDADFVSRNKPSKIVTVNNEEKKLIFHKVRYLNSGIEKKVQSLIKKSAKAHSLKDDSFLMDDMLFLGKENALHFLSDNLGELASSFRLFGTEALKKFKLSISRPKTNLHLKSGINFFEGSCSIEIGSQEFSFEEALKLFEKNNFIPLNDGTNAVIDKKFFDNLSRILGKKNKDGTYNVSFFDLPVVQELIDTKVTGEGFNASQKIYEGFNSINENALKETELTQKLRSYQNYGVKWMKYLAQNNLGGCLADDMGLGKTVQIISLLSEFYDEKKNNEKPSIIVMPKSLISNWQNEFLKFAPNLDIYTYYDSTRDVEEAKKHQIILTTYAVARNDIQELQKIEFNFAILDEIQNIKNLSSQNAKASMLLNAEHRFGLSGTPMENHVGELYSIFRFINPSMFGTENEFNRKYATPIQKDGDAMASKVLSKKLSPFFLRRLKKEVAKELPERTEQVLYVDMSEEQTKLYEERRVFYEKMISGELEKNTNKENGIGKASFLILQGLLELRQLATVPEAKTEGQIQSSKWETLINNIEEISENNHKCLVFTNFLATIDEVSSRLEEKGIKHLVMTGSTNDRASLVKKFQEEDDCKVFIMTLKTGGVGLTLTAADYVYILDPWWNRSAEQQAIDRTHRIGQTKSVFCYRLIARNTIEEKILQLQQKKGDIFSSVISSDSQMMKNLTAEDINYILGK